MKLGPYDLGYTTDDHAGIYEGDALVCLGQLPPNSVDAIITDPPYCSGGISEAGRKSANGQGLRSETIGRFGWFKGDNMGTMGLAWLLRLLGGEAARTLKPTGSLLVFVDWRMLPIIEPAIESSGLIYQSLIVWDKGSMGLGNGFRRQHEIILHYTFRNPEYHDRGTGDVITAKRVSTSDRVNLAQKPLELLTRLISVVAPIGGVVVDPFAGSGSLAVAAYQSGRHYLGFDLDAEAVAVARDAVHSSPVPLFIPSSEQLRLDLSAD